MYILLTYILNWAYSYSPVRKHPWQFVRLEATLRRNCLYSLVLPRASVSALPSVYVRIWINLSTVGAREICWYSIELFLKSLHFLLTELWSWSYHLTVYSCELRSRYGVCWGRLYISRSCGSDINAARRICLKITVFFVSRKSCLKQKNNIWNAFDIF